MSGMLREITLECSCFVEWNSVRTGGPITYHNDDIHDDIINEKYPSTGLQNCLPGLYLGACKCSDLEMTWKVIFRPFLGSQKVRKTITFFENSLLSAVSSLGTLPIVFPMPKRYPPMP